MDTTFIVLLYNIITRIIRIRTYTSKELLTEDSIECLTICTLYLQKEKNNESRLFSTFNSTSGFKNK